MIRTSIRGSRAGSSLSRPGSKAAAKLQAKRPLSFRPCVADLIPIHPFAFTFARFAFHFRVLVAASRQKSRGVGCSLAWAVGGA